MDNPTQDNRLIQLITPLGKDKLLLQAFSGQEGISIPFHYDLSMLSPDKSIKFEDVVGKPATIKIILPSKEPGAGGPVRARCIDGIVSSFTQSGTTTEFASYQATLVPRLWMLTRNADCRIFQQLNAPDIIKTILKENGIFFTGGDRLTAGRYAVREYCVQYSETDFHFISRLMEEEGIFYFFEHTFDKDGKGIHLLVLADDPGQFKEVPTLEKGAEFRATTTAEGAAEGVTSWNVAQEVRPDIYRLRDYNFKQPKLGLLQTAQTGDDPTLEIYDFPGGYTEIARGQQLVDVRMEEIETGKTVISGASNYRALCSGFRFKLTGHFRKDFDNKQYLLTSIFHCFKQGDDFRSSSGDVAKQFSYVNTFQCVPHPTHYRPSRYNQVPVIPGTQTAIVVGNNTVPPEGPPPPDPPPHTPKDEIYMDEFGRVKVRFHWDRARENGDTTCWLRVAQPWAGKGWGHQWIPRIGQEVVVTFLEGDPDRPVITGCLYNGSNPLPFTNPDYRSQSGVRTRSNPGDPDGANDAFHMLRFDDKIGKEQVFLRSQKRLDVRSRASYFDTSGGDRHTLIGGKDDKGNQGGNYYLTVGNDADIHINGGLYQRVEKKLNFTVVGDVVFDFEGNQAVMVKTKSELNAKQVIIEGLEKISLKVGGSFITIDQSGVIISGPMVKINSGGAGNPCGSPDIEDPLDAGAADTGEPGYLDKLPKGGPWTRKKRHLNAQHAPPFVVTKLPDGSLKVGNNIVIKPKPGDPSFQDKVLRDLTQMSNEAPGMDRLNRVNNGSHPLGIEYGPTNQTTFASPQDGAAKGKPAYDGTVGTGKGTDATIQYDPDREPPTAADPTINRPSDVALNHEMTHSEHANNGTYDGTPDAANPNNPTVEETETIDQDNKYRDERILPDGRKVPRRADHTVL